MHPAGPLVDWSDGTTAIGVLRLDADDLAYWYDFGYSLGNLVDVVTHEIGHILGVGTKWAELDLLNNWNATAQGNAQYRGAGGVRGLQLLGKRGLPLVETLGGPGTACVHWRESTYGSELMTPMLDFAGAPLSSMTGLSLIDLGYVLRKDYTFEHYVVPQATSRRRLKAPAHAPFNMSAGERFTTDMIASPRPVLFAIVQT